MSFSKRVRLHCDGPGCTATIQTSRERSRPARKRSRAKGWAYRRLPNLTTRTRRALWADLCPKCSAGDS